MRNRPWLVGSSLVELTLLLGLAGSVRARTPERVQSAAAATAAPTTSVGAATCGSCHQSNYEEWLNGRHSKMVQPATPSTVRGDFSLDSVTLRGGRYGFRVADGQFFITESYLTGREQEHHVEYTLGSRRVQHYLTTLENGRIIILPPSWDVDRGTWFHNMEIVRPDESALTPVQQWNKGCVGCHVSQEAVNYDPATHSYATQWKDFGTSCERCHGPGSAHVAQYTRLKSGGTAAQPLIVRPTRLDPGTSSMICAQCHSLRGVVAPDFTAGAEYYDFFQPVLEYEAHNNRDPSYWADGRPRRFSNDAIGLWESSCFLRGGATCVSCHTDPHEPNVDRNRQLAPSNSALCTRCHQDIGAKLVAHTKHPPDSAGSSCVECHMPKTVVGVKATMRDHTISLPAPENTVAFGIPNACTACHEDKTPAWAVGVLKNWYPRMRRAKLVARAQAFSAAEARKPEALEQLIAIAGDNQQGPLIQANALGYLRYYADPRATAALMSAARADDPAIRSAALSSLKRSPDAVRVSHAGQSSGEESPAAHDGAARTVLLHALDDPRRAVRLSALGSLIKVGGNGLGPDDEARFFRVSREFGEMARLYGDDANIQSAFGALQLLTGQFDLAATALSNSLSLEPDVSSTKFLLALARVGQHRYEDARALLKQVPRSDPMYRPAQERLRHIDAIAR